MTSEKYYVVWRGHRPGIYDSWADCEAQVKGFPGARYKAFSSQREAVAAYRDADVESLAIFKAIAAQAAKQRVNYDAIPEICQEAIAVDGACARNPGPMEYRGVHVGSGRELFHFGPCDGGTNNIAEYLALIHVLALLKKNGDTRTPVYTDSKTALSWLRRGRSNTTIVPNERNGRTIDLLRRADAWLAANKPLTTRVLKWNTEEWGEIPADFGRK